MRAGERLAGCVGLAGELRVAGHADAVRAVRDGHRRVRRASDTEGQEHGDQEAREKPEVISPAEHDRGLRYTS